MTKKQLTELHSILKGLGDKVTALDKKVSGLVGTVGLVQKDQKVLNAKANTAEEQFQKFSKAITNLEVVSIETQRQTRQIHSNMISTADKQGREIRKLKLVANGEPSSGGRRPTRKNS